MFLGPKLVPQNPKTLTVDSLSLEDWGLILGA